MAKNSALLKLLRCKFIIDEIEKGYNPSLSNLTTKTNQWLENINSVIGDVHIDLSERTIKRDIAEIRELFGVHIKSRQGYYIEKESGDTTQLHSTFDTLLLYFIRKNRPDTNKSIRFAPRRATGTDLFFIILKAIKDKKKIEFHYSQYEKREVTMRLVSPLGLKEFKGFWYIVASDKEGIKTFGLDRISSLGVSLENSLVPVDFDLDDYYKHCYGIVRLPNDEPQEIIIKTAPIKAAYYKANPLHHSQKIVEENEDFTTFSLFIYLTYDLQQELRSHGDDQVKVLKPERALDKERYFKSNGFKS